MAKETPPGFVTWNDSASFAKASAETAKGLEKVQPIMRATGAYANRWKNIDQNTSTRDTYSRLDYEYFRPNEAMPRNHQDIIGACAEAYKRISVIRQMIDLMGDFCAQGARLVHPNKSVERFYRYWWEVVHGRERSERFANILYRLGNVVIKRSTGKINYKLASEWKKTIAANDLDLPTSFNPSAREIPVRYDFLNPMVLQIAGGEIATFTGKYKYVLQIPNKITSSLNSGLFGLDPASLLEDIPTDIKNAINTNQRYLLLDPDKLITCYYKKDDWELWAYPMIYSLLDDLIYLEKMKLADLTALDGMISHIRIWKLGSLEHQILPTDAAIGKLSSILLNHVAGGSMDFIWGPDLTIEETSTDLHKFLGSDKYNSVITSIHSGLGIPTSTGGGTGGSFSNNFISLRTIIERLEYGRKSLNEFWMPEIRAVQKAMGFRQPARLVFDNTNFQDDTTEKSLWIQMADRNLISDETIQERFGVIPEIEEIRLKREEQGRSAKARHPKVSPYHDSQPDLSKEKIALQRGAVTPSEVNLQLKDRLPGEKTQLEIQQENMQEKIKEAKKNVGRSGEGRPKMSKDKEKRKTRTVNPHSKADHNEYVNLNLYANQVQKIIHEELTPFFLEKFNKSNLRQLTQAEQNELDNFKHTLLFNVPVVNYASSELVAETLSKPLKKFDFVEKLYESMVKGITERNHQMPTYEEIKNIRNIIYAVFNGQFDNESDDND